MNSNEKFSWEMGVSVISDNRDNHFVKPCRAVGGQERAPICSGEEMRCGD